MTSEYSTELSTLFPEASGAPRRPGKVFDIKRFIRTRWPLMLAVAAACAVPLLAAAWLVIEPEFEAQALIRFKERPEAVLREPGYGARGNYELEVQTQVNIIESSTILLRVLDDPNVRNLSVLADKNDRLRALERLVDAYLNPRTELVVVSARCPDRLAAITIVDTVIDKYIDFAFGQQSEEDEDVTRTLIEEEKSSTQEYNALLGRITKRRELSGPELADEGDSLSARLKTYQDMLSKAQADYLQAEMEAERFRGYLEELKRIQESYEANPSAPIFEHGVEDMVNTHTKVKVLQENLAIAERELAAAEETYREGRMELKASRQSREAARESLDEAKQEARGEILESRLQQYQLSLEEAETKLAGAQARVNEAERSITDAEDRAAQLSKNMHEIEEMEKEAKALELHIASVQNKLRANSVESRAPATIQKVSGAQANQKPDYKKRMQVMLLACMLSCCTGVGAGLLRELTDQQIRTARDAGAVAELPVLAAVPHSSMDQLPESSHPELLMAEHPDSLAADEFRRAISRVIYPPEGTVEINTCLVASPSRGDGRTSLACNLAIALAQANRRVLLVDMSVRRPTIERLFALTPGPGISEILSKRLEPKEVVQETFVSGLDVLGPGTDRREVVGRLASRDIIEMFEQAEQAYDHVVIDTPPALLMADARLLAPVMDGVIIVVGSEVSSSGMVRRCITELRQVGAELMGVVLNGVRRVPGGYLDTNLQQFYAHMGRQAEPEDKRVKRKHGKREKVKSKGEARGEEELPAAEPEMTFEEEAAIRGPKETVLPEARPRPAEEPEEPSILLVDEEDDWREVPPRGSGPSD